MLQQATKYVLEVNNLTKLYKNKRGIQNVSLRLEKGSIYGFLGPNGAGKTTAMKVMTGMMRADSGEVRLFGYDISKNYEQAMKNTGCIIETAEAYPYLTAFENLKLIARYHKELSDVDIDEALKLTGILKYKKEKSKNFSLGMKQRLGLSMALLSKPELVILDEPLNGLDVEGMVDMRNIFKKLSAENGTTFFISSHLIHDVELTCTHIGIILNGSMRTEDSMDNILKNYASLEDFFLSEVDKYGKS